MTQYLFVSSPRASTQGPPLVVYFVCLFVCLFFGLFVVVVVLVVLVLVLVVVVLAGDLTPVYKRLDVESFTQNYFRLIEEKAKRRFLGEREFEIEVQ